MQPVRVLQVIRQMNHGGIETFLMSIYRNIDRNRIQFDFLTFRKTRGYFDDEIESLGGKVYYLESVMNMKNLLTGAVNRKLFCFFVEHPVYRIVHSHGAWSGIVLKNAERAKIQTRVAHSHNVYLPVPFGITALKNMVKNTIKSSVNRYATNRFACSQMGADWFFGKKSQYKWDIELLPNAIDCKKFSTFDPAIRKKIRLELGISDQAFLLIHVGRLSLQKNHLFLIDVFDALVAKVPDSKLLLVGADNMNGKCQKYASKKSAASKIKFLGARSDVAELLQAGDVFLFPSFYEGFGISVLEAQSSGLPCIISDTIPNEVCLTDNIVQLPINKGTDIWVDKILEFKEKTRADNYEILVKKDYDIHNLCQKLTEFYESAYAE